MWQGRCRRERGGAGKARSHTHLAQGSHDHHHFSDRPPRSNRGGACPSLRDRAQERRRPDRRPLRVPGSRRPVRPPRAAPRPEGCARPAFQVSPAGAAGGTRLGAGHRLARERTDRTRRPDPVAPLPDGLRGPDGDVAAREPAYPRPRLRDPQGPRAAGRHIGRHDDHPHSVRCPPGSEARKPAAGAGAGLGGAGRAQRHLRRRDDHLPVQRRHRHQGPRDERGDRRQGQQGDLGEACPLPDGVPQVRVGRQEVGRHQSRHHAHAHRPRPGRAGRRHRAGGRSSGPRWT